MLRPSPDSKTVRRTTGSSSSFNGNRDESWRTQVDVSNVTNGHFASGQIGAVAAAGLCSDFLAAAAQGLCPPDDILLISSVALECTTKPFVASHTNLNVIVQNHTHIK